MTGAAKIEDAMGETTLIDMLLDQTERLIADHVDRDTLRTVENGTWPDRLWTESAALGLPDALTVPAADGGLSFADAGALFALRGSRAMPLPLGETILARMALTQAGIEAPDGPIGFLTRNDADIPFGIHLKHVVRARRDEIRLYSLDGATVTPTASISREGYAALDIAALMPTTSADWPASLPDPAVLGAMLVASQIAGGLGRVLEMTVDYALVRTQFARPIGRFQAVQQLIAQLAAEAAAARAAADAAWAALDAGGDVAMMGAIAKIRAGEAVPIAAAIAHQVHGAIGITDEHMLHYHTRRLWQWRRDHGSDAHWAEWLGREVQDSGAGLWSVLTQRCGVAPARVQASS
jgi:acyl-CoA dehydrogenase